MQIIHIATDNKFINHAYWQFNEVFPGQNTFYLLVKDPTAPIKHVHLNSDFTIVKNDIDRIKKFAQEHRTETLFCFHGLDYYSSILLFNLPEKHKILWMLWGSEIYGNNRIIPMKEALGPLTKALVKEPLPKRFTIMVKDFLGKLPVVSNLRKESVDQVILKAIKRVNYCGVLHPLEHNLVREKTNTDSAFFRFCYFPIELMVEDPQTRIISDNILVGNSATYTNNHLEIFKNLQSLPINDRKIVVPLNYGDNDGRYSEIIIREGNERFGNHFEPLTEFMPLHSYNKFLGQCGIVVMNHYRQQAVGVVLTMLWLGAKVYLNENSNVYHCLKAMGLSLFSIQKDLTKENREVFALLSEKNQDLNRTILKKQIGKNVLLQDLETQLHKIEKEKN